jgi:hypothetical protein
MSDMLTKSEKLAQEMAQFGHTDFSYDSFRKCFDETGLSPVQEEYLIEKCSELQHALSLASKSLSKFLSTHKKLEIALEGLKRIESLAISWTHSDYICGLSDGHRDAIQIARETREKVGKDAV